MNDLNLAWRNLWRNRRRTLITAASIFFAIFFALVMRSFQLGSYRQIFMNVVESYTGYLQLQHRDYYDEPVPDNSFELTPDIGEQLAADINVESIVPRFEAFALAAAGSATQGVMVMGIDPEGEDRISGVRDRLVQFRLTPEAVAALKNESLPSRTKNLFDIFSGESWSGLNRLIADLGIDTGDSAAVMRAMRHHASFPNSYLDADNPQGVLIGSGLSQFLKANRGDTLVLVGQGYYGTSAAGKYVVAGVVKLPAPDIDNRIVYMPIETARELFAAPGMATSAVLMIRDKNDRAMLATAERLNKKLEEPLVVHTWHKLNALLINQMEADNRSGAIMIGILYLVIAFGVFGTVLMMLAERRREFGMLTAVGMQKTHLARVFALEMVMTGFIGILAGVIASLPVVFYLHFHPYRFTGNMARMYEDYGFDPVMPTMLPDTYYLWQMVVVLLIIVFALSYSIRKIINIKVITALKA
jgi:ABC-type lipoprotein release transport system permease subunit